MPKTILIKGSAEEDPTYRNSTVCVCVCVFSDGSLAESIPLKDRMALYQAAVSKQEVTPTSVGVSSSSPF